jgi:hypothetical protein
MAKLKIWHQGERSEALCTTCGDWRATEFQYRTFRLEKSRKDVPDVLVAVCTVCDSIAAVPQQSAPKLREARRRDPSRVDARIPKELRDLVGVLAAEFGGEPEPFAGGMVRYYLREIIDDRSLARRVARLAKSEDAKGTPGGRLAFRLDKRLLREAMAAARRAHVTDKSALVRGIIVAARQDAYDDPDEMRRAALRAIAVAAGA